MNNPSLDLGTLVFSGNSCHFHGNMLTSHVFSNCRVSNPGRIDFGKNFLTVNISQPLFFGVKTPFVSCSGCSVPAFPSRIQQLAASRSHGALRKWTLVGWWDLMVSLRWAWGYGAWLEHVLLKEVFYVEMSSINGDITLFDIKLRTKWVEPSWNFCKFLISP